MTRVGELPVRPLPLALSGVLGVGAALLVACGGSSKLIPAGNASQLRSDFDAVAAAVSSGSCDTALRTATAAAGTDIAALPSTVDPRLTASLQAGVRTLTSRAAVECRQQSTTSTTPTNTTPTVTQTNTTTTPTNTTPTQTNTTTTPTNTTTTQTDTTTTNTTPTDTTQTGATVPIVPGNGGGTPAPNGQTGQVRTSAGGATGAGGTGFGGGN